jgi:PPOX class probable F420-dependent enzyme
MTTETGISLSQPMQAFLEEVQPAIVGTVRADGTVQMNPIWYDFRDGLLWLNPASSRAWGRKLEPGVPVTLIMVDPSNQWRWAQIQGEVVDKTREGAEEHIDRLSQRYLGRDYADHREDDPRLLVSVRPLRVIQSSVEEEAA